MKRPPIDSEAARHESAVSSARSALVTAALSDDAAALAAAKRALATAEADRLRHDETRERAARAEERARCIECAEILERAQDVADWQERAARFREMAAGHDTRIADIDRAHEPAPERARIR